MPEEIYSDFGNLHDKFNKDKVPRRYIIYKSK